MSLSKFYLTVGSDRLRIPLTPNSISVKEGTTSVSFQVIKIGEHKIPRGTSVTGYSWSGTLPGKNMSDLGFVFDWQDPKEIIKKLKKWQCDGTIIDFTATETGIKDNVFIESATFTHKGAGNVDYQINLSAYRPLSVTTAPPQPKVKIPVEKPKPQPTTQPKPTGSKKTPPKTDPKKEDGTTPLSVTIPTTSLASVITTGITIVSTVAKVVSTVTSGIKSIFGGK